MRWLRNPTFQQHQLIPPIVLVAVIVAIYFPALYSGMHPIDDPGILAKFGAAPPLSTLLLPGSGYYYRPLVELSFWFDNLLWGLEPRTMHLESILLHCMNSMLVFWLARESCSTDTASPMLVPLLVALLFAVHPVNVEAVAWIAGRTDLLLAMLCLASLWFWFRWLAVPQWQYLLPAILLLCASLFAKETAFAFFSVVLLIILFWPGRAVGSQRLRAAALVLFPVVVLIVSVLFFQRGTGALSRFISGANVLQADQLWYAGLTAVGFYVKKLLFPFPLNFAIDSVNPYYWVAGLLIPPLVWWCWRLCKQVGILFLAALFCILPAVLVAVKQVAWTPYAERYLYLPSAFFLLGIVQQLCNKQRKRMIVVLAFLGVVFSVTSFQQTLLWQHKRAFFENAVSQSPEFGSLYATLGELLMQDGEFDRASDAFVLAERFNKRPSMVYPIKADIMSAMLAKGHYWEVNRYFYTLFEFKRDAPEDFVELLYKADTRRLDKLQERDKPVLAQDIIETLIVLNQKKPDPFWFYQGGKYALIAGNKDQAVTFFKRAYDDAPFDAHYKEAAQKQLIRLGQVR